MATESDAERGYSVERHSRRSDRTISALAEEQGGVISHDQLEVLGLDRSEIWRRIDAGHLIIVHRGVYAVGYRPLTDEGRISAAILAAGDGAVASHSAAAALWGMRPYGGEKIHVTVPLTQRRGHEDVVVHRHCLEEDEITTRDGLPVTVPLRTILDVAQVIKGVPLERAIRQAEYHRLVAIESLVAAVDANPGRRGIRNLRRALVGCVEVPGLTRSALEEKFAHFVRRRALPRPRLNVQLHVADRIVEVDVLWPKHRVVVELDGKAAHANIRAFESDRARDGALQAAGYVVTRVTWQRLQRDQARLAAELRAILAHRE